MDVLKKINKFRIERGWSVYKLSEVSGISQSTLTNMFNRETLPSLTTMYALCDAFNISMSEFFSEGENGEILTSDEEKLLLSRYRSLNFNEKEVVSSLVKILSEK